MQTYLNFPSISPEIFSVNLWGIEIALRWYAVAYIVGLLLGMLLVRGLMRRPGLWAGNTPPMPPEETDDLLTYMIIGVILGGRLGFVLFYQPAYYLENPGEILAIWRGGMSFHGGFLGVVVGVVVFCLIRKRSIVSVGDAVAIAAPIGIGLGRLANFINGELWGRPTTVPWGMVFPDPRAQTCPATWVGECGRHPSQLYEAALEGALLFAIMIWLARSGWLKSPGRMIGVFMAGYGAARALIEFFREPDAQFVTSDNINGWVLGLGDFGVTQGQLLSLPMLALGLVLILASTRRRS